ncbi:LURP-one-related/scramblase family protein [Micromonospora zhanjiangensis]|uniref:Scramblase n=1 Tax=Micromonospora zhanjiangensis TaxID=1522057 RepID=A0ABV8KP32_9ACTN
MRLDELQAQRHLLIRQRIRFMVNQYEVHAVAPDGSEGELLAFAQQKRLAFKEQVTLYTDDSKQQPVLGFRARQVLDLGATYDVTDASGAAIGLFRKDFGQSLLRSTWHVEQPGLGQLTGQERSLPVALLRRFVDSLSWLPYHFDFTMNGQPAFSVVKKWGLRDRYVVEIHHPQLDRRLVIAMAVGLDALQSR